MSDWVEEVMPEIPDYIVNGVQVTLDEKDDLYAEWTSCPECGLAFAIDVTYLEQVTLVVSCPSCGMKIKFAKPIVTP